MDFDLTEEQRLLDETVRRLIKDEYDFEKRKTYRASPQGFSSELWSRYAEIGLLGLPFPESEGGFGGTAVETMLVMENFGRGLVLEPRQQGAGWLRPLAPVRPGCACRRDCRPGWRRRHATEDRPAWAGGVAGRAWA